MFENIPIIKSIIELLSAILGFIKKLFGGREKNNYQIDIPKKTIIIAPNPDAHYTWWHMGSSSGKPAMQVSGKFKVTNITKYRIILCAAKMKKPNVFGHVSGELSPTSVTDISFDFWIIPAFKEKGEPFMADVAIIDQFGNEHWIKEINFIYT